MNKKKRIFASFTVSLSVFILSAVFSVTGFFPSVKEKNALSEAVLSSVTELGKTNDGNIDLQLFSYTSGIANDRINNLEATDTEAVPEASNNDNTGAPADLSDDAGTPAGSTDNNNDTAEKLEENTDQDITAVSDEKQAEAEETEITNEAPEEVREALYANIGISIADNFVYIRKDASTDSEILGKLYRDCAATILSSENGWYQVESGSVKGYIKSEFLKTGIPDEELTEKYGELRILVSVDGLNVRETADTEAARLDVVYLNEIYPVEELQDEWVKIKVEDNNITGYVMRKYTELIVKFKEAVSKEEEQELLKLQAEEKAKKETEVIYGNEVSYCTEDLKLLACLVHAEAGTQSYEGKLAVANIVLNRVRSSKYPNSIKKVIYQSGQFTVSRSGSLDKQLANYSNYNNSNSQKLSVKAAKAALEGANNIGSRLYFHSYTSAVKKGYDKKKNAVKIQDHLFW